MGPSGLSLETHGPITAQPPCLQAVGPGVFGVCKSGSTFRSRRRTRRGVPTLTARLARGAHSFLLFCSILGVFSAFDPCLEERRLLGFPGALQPGGNGCWALWGDSTSRTKYTCETACKVPKFCLVSIATASSPTRKLDLRVSSRTWSLEASAVVEWRQSLHTTFPVLPLVWAALAYTAEPLYRITQTHTKPHCTISTWPTPEPSGQVTEQTVHYKKLIL